LGNPVIEELSSLSARLRSTADGIRWSTPETWHITLQFLGNIGPEQYNCIVARLRELRSPPVPVELGEMGVFDKAGIVFASTKPTPELLSLQQRVIASTRLCGFMPESRPYHPHIALGRSKGKAGAQLLRVLKDTIRLWTGSARFVAEEFLLYESLPTPTGSRYEIREHFPLMSFREPGLP
jgi:2'-5' RNA ligase